VLEKLAKIEKLKVPEQDHIQKITYKKGKEKIEVYNKSIIDLTERSGYEPHFIIIYKIGIREAS